MWSSRCEVRRYNVSLKLNPAQKQECCLPPESIIILITLLLTVWSITNSMQMCFFFFFSAQRSVGASSISSGRPRHNSAENNLISGTKLLRKTEIIRFQMGQLYSGRDCSGRGFILLTACSYCTLGFSAPLVWEVSRRFNKNTAILPFMSRYIQSE